MSRTTLGLGPEMQDYLAMYGGAVDPVLRDLAEETAKVTGGAAQMQVAPEQGRFLTLLARLLNARSVVEVGTFTGYSSICLARGMAPGGHLIACDVSEEWTAIARRYWERAGVADLIELRLGPAGDTLARLPDENTLDLAFIDADKPGYPDYWEQLVPRLRPGGLVVVDNVFYGGEVIEDNPSENGAAIQRFNARAVADPRVELVMLPIADGVTIARRLGG